MRLGNAAVWCATLAVIFAATGPVRSTVEARLVNQGQLSNGAQAQNEGKPPPIPRASPLAKPKPLKQVGLPNAATRAAVPSDNPQTPEKIALGEKLFFDGRLSADGTVACSTCHDPALAFTDGRTVSIGIKG